MPCRACLRTACWYSVVSRFEPYCFHKRSAHLLAWKPQQPATASGHTAEIRLATKRGLNSLELDAIHQLLAATLQRPSGGALNCGVKPASGYQEATLAQGYRLQGTSCRLAWLASAVGGASAVSLQTKSRSKCMLNGTTNPAITQATMEDCRQADDNTCFLAGHCSCSPARLKSAALQSMVRSNIYLYVLESASPNRLGIRHAGSIRDALERGLKRWICKRRKPLFPELAPPPPPSAPPTMTPLPLLELSGRVRELPRSCGSHSAIRSWHESSTCSLHCQLLVLRILKSTGSSLR